MVEYSSLAVSQPVAAVTECVVKSRKDLHKVHQTFGLRKKILVLGAIAWLPALMILALAFRFSTCSSGLWTPMYGVPVLAFIAKDMYESRIIRDLMEFHGKVRFEREELSMELPFQEGTGLDDPRMLHIMGSALLMDLHTDNVQAVQTWFCEKDFIFHEQYVDSFIGMLSFMKPFANTFGLSGVFFAMLITIYLVQGVWGFLKVFGAERDLLEAKDHWGGIYYLENLAFGAEWGCALRLSRLLKEHAKAETVGAHGEYEDGSKMRVFFASAIRHVLLENVPSLYLTTIVFCLKFNGMTRVGISKTIFSFILSAGSAMAKAKDAWKIVDWHCHYRGKVMAIFITFFIFAMAFKICMAFFCESHIFSIFAMRCVAVV